MVIAYFVSRHFWDIDTAHFSQAHRNGQADCQSVELDQPGKLILAE